MICVMVHTTMPQECDEKENRRRPNSSAGTWPGSTLGQVSDQHSLSSPFRRATRWRHDTTSSTQARHSIAIQTQSTDQIRVLHVGRRDVFGNNHNPAVARRTAYRVRGAPRRWWATEPPPAASDKDQNSGKVLQKSEDSNFKRHSITRPRRLHASPPLRARFVRSINASGFKRRTSQTCASTALSSVWSSVVPGCRLSHALISRTTSSYTRRAASPPHISVRVCQTCTICDQFQLPCGERQCS